MRGLIVVVIYCAALAACVTPRAALAPAPWDERLHQLQRPGEWQLEGRAAVAIGSQGWQASLNWRQQDAAAEVHLSGPLGVGAVVLRETPAGLSLNGAPPSDAVIAQLQDRLGFELPLSDLRYWLLGVPDPSAAFELTRNADDRAVLLVQAGWTLNYERYKAVNGDLLPDRMTMSREGVRLRIAVDRWQGVR